MLLQHIYPSISLWIKEAVAIFFLTFLHEDAAIIAAAFAKVEHGLPLFYAYLPLYFGIVSGDIVIYGMGRLAQTNGWLRSKIIGPKVEKVKSWIENNLVRMLILCRITPGLLFPTFVACGWFKISFWRFTIVSILTGAIYSSIVLTLVIIFGDLVLYNLGYWAWGILVAVAILFAFRNFFRKGFNKNIEATIENQQPGIIRSLKRHLPDMKKKFNGMPSLDDLRKFVSTAEKIPNNILYIPVGLRWLLLSLKYRSLTLPSAANPMIETGGFMGESKASVLDMVGPEQRNWLADYVLFHRDDFSTDKNFQNAIEIIKTKNFNFPLVAKPDIGWNGYGVRIIENEPQLWQYLDIFPAGANIIFQELVNYDGEAGIFYIRMPGEPKGKIYSITLRYFPYVKGDGKSTLRQLIENDERSKLRAHLYMGSNPKHTGFSNEELRKIPEDGEMIRLAFIGSLRAGGLYRNGTHLVTTEIEERFDRIARSIPEFYYGRFDIRFESIEFLQKGERFKIIEINGAGAEAIQAWDPNVSLIKLYREFFRAQSLLFKIGNMNRKRGYKPMPVKDFIRAIKKQNQLIDAYPPAC